MTAPTGWAPTPAARVMERIAQNPHYKRAVETPAYLHAVEMRAALLRKRAELPRVHPIPSPSDPAELDAWIEQSSTARTLQRDHSETDEAISREIAKQERLIQSVAANANPILAALNSDLAAVMGVAAAIVQRLDGTHTAAAIVASRDPARMDAYTDLAELREKYDAIRVAQDWTTAGDPRDQHARSTYLDDPLASDTAISNLDQIFPAWKHRSPDIAIMRWDQPDARPWPKDPVEQLIWMVVSDAQPWIPTWDDLDKLKQRRITERAHTSGRTRRPKQRQERPLSKSGHADDIINQEVSV